MPWSKQVRAGYSVAEIMHDKQFEAIASSSNSSEAEARGNPRKAAPEDLELRSPVRYVPASNPPGSVGDFIDDVAIGDIVVIDNGGRKDCTVWGDIMTRYAGIRGLAGTVIDGVCRDVDPIIKDDYPIFTAGNWMRTGKDRVQVGGINESVGVGNVRVSPRDIVVADANGVVIVPRDRAHEVAALTKSIEKSEQSILALIHGGSTITEAREKLGYHTLQRRA
ncbi:unnamed protein product [Clonostachys rosea f. rosea IK726]|uniref:Uncharacterized protein n=1 Tax=Clonostachys rosea f. rosea IK726 TaxID=1349383 RepID=A0ACA9UGE4_BIOOC|nr:unnamed protein product [Clonostachys rosea f. rosea IK726]